jgi:hypothetical protein
MEENFVVELLEDLDHMRQLLERCVRKLRTQVSGDVAIPTFSSSQVPQMPSAAGDIRAEIERQRQAILAQVEQAKAQAMSAVTAARTTGIGVPSGMSMPTGLPAGVPGDLPGISGAASSPELFEKLRQHMIEQEKKK